MAYSTEQQVRSILVGRRGEDRGETPNELDNDQIEFAIRDADAQIDMVLRRRYVVPVEPVPALVNALSVNIAAYLATLMFKGTTVLDATDPSAIRYDRARRLLADIQGGRVDIDAVEQTTAAGEVDGAVFNLLDSPLFPTHPWFGSEHAEGVIPPDVIYPRTF